jgi:hypothetical protein
MRYLTIIFIICINSFLQGQSYHSAEIALNNGTYKTGHAKVPNGDQKKIDFKETLEGKSIKLNSDDIATITLTLKDGRIYTLERNQVKMIGAKKSGVVVSRVGKKKGWFYVGHSNSIMNYYTAGQKYKIDKNGDFRITSKGQAGFAGIGYYLRRPGEEHVTYITARMSGIQISHEKMFRNAASVYFGDDKKLVNRIKNKEFKSNQLHEVYEIYISKKR